MITKCDMIQHGAPWIHASLADNRFNLFLWSIRQFSPTSNSIWLVPKRHWQSSAIAMLKNLQVQRFIRMFFFSRRLSLNFCWDGHELKWKWQKNAHTHRHVLKHVSRNSRGSEIELNFRPSTECMCFRTFHSRKCVLPKHEQVCTILFK